MGEIGNNKRTYGGGTMSNYYPTDKLFNTRSDISCTMKIHISKPVCVCWNYSVKGIIKFWYKALCINPNNLIEKKIIC